MAKHWTKVKEEIEADIDRIMWDEPEEITKSMRGIFPSGAGTGGQALGNMMFLCSDLEALGPLFAVGAGATVKDDSFTLDHVKKLWIYMNEYMCELLGASDPPECPAPWLNLPKVLKFCKDIIGSFETVKTKEEFADLIWSWNGYMLRMYWWAMLKFPWHLGLMFPRIEPKHIEELAKLSALKLEK